MTRPDALKREGAVSGEWFITVSEQMDKRCAVLLNHCGNITGIMCREKAVDAAMVQLLTDSEVT
jgi:hypothetical protein